MVGTRSTKSHEASRNTRFFPVTSWIVPSSSLKSRPRSLRLRGESCPRKAHRRDAGAERMRREKLKVEHYRNEQPTDQASFGCWRARIKLLIALVVSRVCFSWNSFTQSETVATMSRAALRAESRLVFALAGFRFPR